MLWQAHFAGAASGGVGATLVDLHFSFRMDSFQIVLACSSEQLNGLSVPRFLRYSAFVIFDILHHRMGGAVRSESCLQLSSVLLASIRVHGLYADGRDSSTAGFPDHDRSAGSPATPPPSIPPEKRHCGPLNPDSAVETTHDQRQQ